jgi:hypothetical protein
MEGKDDDRARDVYDEFDTHVKEWEDGGGRLESEARRMQFAEHVSDKYLATKLDALAKSFTVRQIRKLVARRIDDIEQVGVEAVVNQQTARGTKQGRRTRPDSGSSSQTSGNEHASSSLLDVLLGTQMESVAPEQFVSDFQQKMDAKMDAKNKTKNKKAAVKSELPPHIHHHTVVEPPPHHQQRSAGDAMASAEKAAVASEVDDASDSMAEIKKMLQETKNLRAKISSQQQQKQAQGQQAEGLAVSFAPHQAEVQERHQEQRQPHSQPVQPQSKQEAVPKKSALEMQHEARRKEIQDALRSIRKNISSGAGSDSGSDPGPMPQHQHPHQNNARQNPQHHSMQQQQQQRQNLHIEHQSHNRARQPQPSQPQPSQPQPIMHTSHNPVSNTQPQPSQQHQHSTQQQQQQQRPPSIAEASPQTKVH